MGVAQHSADFCPYRKGRQSGGTAKFANLSGNITVCERIVGKPESEIEKRAPKELILYTSTGAGLGIS
jgi:hypothetical protein